MVASIRVNLPKAKMRQEIALLRSPLEEPSVRYWRAAGRATLLILLAFAALQYYFFDVQLTILSLPSVSLVAALP